MDFPLSTSLAFPRARRPLRPGHPARLLQRAPAPARPHTAHPHAARPAANADKDALAERLRTLEAADARRRELVANMSHDLRTPLAALQGYLETLLMKADEITPDEQRAYLTTAMRHGERLGNLINALFELAKLDCGEAQPHLEAFCLAGLVQDVAQQFGLAAGKQNVHLETRFAPGLPLAYADIGLVERALGNLLDNALRHTPSGGRITIALRHESERMSIKITDTGSGIQIQDLPRIFERCYHAHAARNADGESNGAGLGLAITRRIVELHGGDISAQSTPGQGATFTFSLPVHASAHGTIRERGNA